MVVVLPSDVAALAPEFKTLSLDETEGGGQDQLELMIEIARNFVCEGKWGDPKAKQAITMLAAHFATDILGPQGTGTGGGGAGAGVTMEKVGDLQRSYGQLSTEGFTAQEKIFATTKYGRMFIALRRTLSFTPFVL